MLKCSKSPLLAAHTMKATAQPSRYDPAPRKIEPQMYLCYQRLVYSETFSERSVAKCGNEIVSESNNAQFNPLLDATYP